MCGVWDATYGQLKAAATVNAQANLTEEYAFHSNTKEGCNGPSVEATVRRARVADHLTR